MPGLAPEHSCLVAPEHLHTLESPRATKQLLRAVLRHQRLQAELERFDNMFFVSFLKGTRNETKNILSNRSTRVSVRVVCCGVVLQW